MARREAPQLCAVVLLQRSVVRSMLDPVPFFLPALPFDQGQLGRAPKRYCRLVTIRSSGRPGYSRWHDDPKIVLGELIHVCLTCQYILSHGMVKAGRGRGCTHPRRLLSIHSLSTSSFSAPRLLPIPCVRRRRP